MTATALYPCTRDMTTQMRYTACIINAARSITHNKRHLDESEHSIADRSSWCRNKNRRNSTIGNLPVPIRSLRTADTIAYGVYVVVYDTASTLGVGAWSTNHAASSGRTMHWHAPVVDTSLHDEIGTRSDQQHRCTKHQCRCC